MINYNYIEAAKDIVSLLNSHDFKKEANLIFDCINYSSTGGEIISCCSVNLSQFLKENDNLSPTLKKEIKKYLDKTKNI